MTAIAICRINRLNTICTVRIMYGALYVLAYGAMLYVRIRRVRYMFSICTVRTAIKRLDKERDRNPPAFFLAPAFFLIYNQTRATAHPARYPLA